MNLQVAFDKRDKDMRSKTGVSEDFSEVGGLLSGMSEGRTYFEAWKVATKEAEREKKRREEAGGAFVVERSLRRRNFQKLNGCPVKNDREDRGEIRG